MKKWYNKLFLNSVRKAVEKFNMIEDNDNILVGISGGKDSSFLLYTLIQLRQASYLNFNITGVHIDLGFKINLSEIENFCKKNNVELIVEKTDIGNRIFNSDKNPCYLCSKLKRGALSRIALKYKFNKIALGHHSTDAVETFLLNLIYTGKLGSFKPNTYNEEKNIHVIRPLIYVNEETIEKVVELEQLPLAAGGICPVDKKTKREEMKQLLTQLKNLYPDIESKTIKALENIDTNNLWN
ncbi:tRNA 2-thiocytidine(32) synthetase TtcA [Caldisalinibacter kiritimatiensis]|uniref:tRNA(Cytosine32)-2-thiocytidine synthetase n=1 Tax=Caldisalinibacter kiritimatiensis TaxID=1304284 RepID=R1ARX8_9FIRM|nr:tRNA 2-thiocytidine(32) synthetase TtcA [Caldisalinibacter kiritimatiensis]EOC99897.1 tRNA(Cytosine32)-2-thiocytidine synthetase [Caldisalinibacter kiritimatiensis]